MNRVSEPATLGFESKRLQSIDAWMQRYIDEGKFAGSSVMVARQGQIAHLASVGKRSLDDDLPFETDTIVRIYSMTKPIVSAALMMLVSDGLLHLDAPIKRFLPEFDRCRALVANAKSVDDTTPCAAPTVHQLLTHTSGLTYAFNPGLLAAHYVARKIDFNPRSGGLAQMVQRVAESPLAFQPGTRWEYSVSIDVIGRLIEVIADESLADVLKKRVFEPLAMADTAFGVTQDQLGRYADCYAYRPDEPLHLCDAAKTSEFALAGVNTFSGGGGLVSTLADYFRFAEMLRRGGSLDGERLLSPRIVAYMMSNHLPGDIASMGPKSFAEMPMQGVGFGIGGSMVLDPALAHVPGSMGDYGWGGMASTFFWVDPVEAITAIFFTQLIPSSTYPNRAELKALIHSALMGA
jgi:CubicO group peptidase (beta-lactamase class C family)